MKLATYDVLCMHNRDQEIRTVGFSCLPATRVFYFDWLMAAKINPQISQNEVDHCFSSEP